MRRFTVCILMFVAMLVTPLHAQIPPSLAALDGKATDVGLGANGVLWAIGTDAVPGGRTIHRWNGTAWDRIPGGAVRVAVDPQGAAWVVNDAKAIFRWTGTTWQTVPGDAIDVGIGADGTVWVLNGAGTPHRWANGSWTAIDGRGASIAVGPKGGPWIVGANGEVFHYNLDKKVWTPLPGQAKDISVAADGTAYMIGSPGGKLFRLDATQWTVVEATAAGERITAGPLGTIVIARAGNAEPALLRAGRIAAPATAVAAAPPAAAPAPVPPPAAAPSTVLIQRPPATSWSTLSGSVTDVGIGANGVLWAIGGDAVPGGRKILRWTGAAWETVPGGAVRIAVDPTGRPWVVNDRNTIFRWMGSGWETMSGAASDVGIGADGTVWVIGSGGTPYRWTGSGWSSISGGGTSIAVGPKGEPWVVNAAGSIWRYTMPSGPWELLPGKGQDIAVAADGTAYVVGTGAGTVSVLRGTTWVADPSATGSRIAAGPAETLVVVKAGAPLVAGTIAAPAATPSLVLPPEVGKISVIQPPPTAPPPAPSGTASAGQPITITQTGQSIPVDPNAPAPSGAPTQGDQNLQVTGGLPSSAPLAPAPVALPSEVGKVSYILPPPPAMAWSPLPGNVAVTDIGVGANNALWAIGGDAVPGGQKIFRWTGSAWETVPGGAVRIAVDPTGNAWVTNDHGTIFRRKGSDWEAMPGTATDVGIGADGTVWVIGSGGTPHRWDGSAWKSISGGGTSIAVGPKGEPWVVNAAGSIWRYPMPSGPWELVSGKAQDIAIAADGTAFVVGTGTGTVSRLHGGAWVADSSAAGSRIAAGAAGTVVVAKAGTPLLAGSLRAPEVAPVAAPSGAPTTIAITQTGQSIAVNPNAPPPSVTPAPAPTGQNLEVTAGVPTSIPAPQSPPPAGLSLVYRPSPGIIPGHMVCSDGADSTLFAAKCGTVEPLDLGPYRVAVPTDCPAGSFWDAIFGGTCWKCDGDRTTEKVDSPDACAKEKLYKATKVSNAVTAFTCPAQTFWDGYNGGACYHCGNGSRTGHPINSDQSCSTMGHTPAQFVKNVGCTEHGSWEIGKPRPYPDVAQAKCFACPVIDEKTKDVLIAEKTINSEGDCRVKVRWKPTTVLGKRITGYDQATQLQGSGALVREILADHERVTAYLKFRAQEVETPAAEIPAFIEQHWAEIAANPNEQPVIVAMLLDRTLRALVLPASQRTPAEQRVLDGFKEYVQLKREAVPGDALGMYQAWKTGVEDLRATRKMHLADLLYYGTVPLDFDTAAQAVGVGSALAMGTAGVAGSMAAFNANLVPIMGTETVTEIVRGVRFADDVVGSIERTTKTGVSIQSGARAVPTSTTRAIQVTKEVKKVKDVYNGINDSFKAVRSMIRAGSLADDVAKGGEVIAAGARATAAGARTAKEAVQISQYARQGVTGARAAITGASAAAAGAMVITIVWGILLDVVIDQVIAIETAEPLLQGKLDAAKAPVSLETMLASPEGPAELTLMWTSMLGERNAPEPDLVGVAAKAAAAARAAGYPTGVDFASVTGKATDIARGEDGSTWIVDDEGAIQRRREGSVAWTTAPGRAVRIAAGSGDDAWVVTAGGELLAWQSNTWSRMCGADAGSCAGIGPATDVAVSAAGAVWAVNRAGAVYRFDRATGWFPVSAPVPMARIDAAGLGLAAAVDANGKLYLLLNDGWADLATPPVADVALNETGDVWVVWKEGGVSFLPVGSTTWQGVRMQGPFTAIAAGNHPAVTGTVGIRIADRGFVVPPAATPSGPSPITTVPLPTIPGMARPEAIQILSFDLARRQVTARARGGAELVTVTSPNTAVFATLSIGGRIWLDRASGKVSLDGTTACCTATIAEGPTR